MIGIMRGCPKTVFLLTGVALWLAVGNEVHAGLVCLTVDDSQQGVSVDRNSSATGMGGYRKSDDGKGNNPTEQNSNPLILTFASLIQNGETAGSMSTGPSNSSGGTTYVAVVFNDPLCISPHLMNRLVLESASRPPAPYLSGVFHPPRST